MANLVSFLYYKVKGLTSESDNVSAFIGSTNNMIFKGYVIQICLTNKYLSIRLRWIKRAAPFSLSLECDVYQNLDSVSATILSMANWTLRWRPHIWDGYKRGDLWAWPLSWHLQPWINQGGQVHCVQPPLVLQDPRVGVLSDQNTDTFTFQ